MANILLVVSHQGNRRVLVEMLSRHRLIHPENGELPDDEVDLIIIDFNSLRKNRELVSRIRDVQAPTLVPALLMLRESQLGHTRDLLGNYVDEVVFTPALTAELTARVRNLLRLRQLSRGQHELYLASETQLRRVDRAYRLLADCNEVTLRACDETGLLETVLSKITGPNGYLLAWAGMQRPASEHSVEIVAAQGSRAAIESGREAILRGEADENLEVAAQAIEERQPVIQSGGSLPASDFVIRQGIKAVAALPLLFEDNADAGVLVIYSTVPTAFHDGEVDLLRRMADNAAYGISALRTRDLLDEQRALANERSYRDPLTGLPNRQYLKEELARLDSEADRHPRHAALLFVDLDGFKRINDSLGHVVGDRLLRLVAERLNQLAREEDFVARLGGDEFVFLVYADHPESDTEWATPSEELVRASTLLAERLVDHMRQPFRDGAHEHRLGVSVGISVFPEDTPRATDLINLADMAMYNAKAEGGDQFHFYSPALTHDQRQRLELENELREAVDQDQLVTFYQPILNLKSGRVEFIEALMRWPRPDGSLRKPENFLKMLEETGLIHEAGEYLFRQACQTLARCRSIQPDLRMTLNLSVNQLSEPKLLDRLKAISESERVAPGALILEVTEDSLLRNSHRTERVLARLHSSGFDVAIDDFGIGHSSLSRLRELPVAMLKLDKSFLREGSRGKVSRELIRSIRDMAGALDLRLVAEGIETEEQWAMVRDLSYGLGQGFFFARPMPEPELKVFLQNQPETSYRYPQVR
ncbi:putative bifunctional diguanylate cyclase/phosphodiesterase [Marinobacter sp.]|uniref:putative bifunctional diguanylate cyclase/phosphodiesterase n=1 Tax=Marinobacter sp. TaxID=50741 RepID=UPI00384FA0CA